MMESRLAYLGRWIVFLFAIKYPVRFLFVRVGPKEVREKPDIAAFHIVHIVPILALCYFALAGRADWIWEQPLTLDGRMYAADPSGAAERICLIQIALQIFVLATALATREPTLLKPELLVHHLVTGAVMVQCLRPLSDGGGLFATSRIAIFFGLTELSTVPLTIVDAFKSFKDLRARRQGLDFGAKVTFMLLFLIIRVGIVTPHSVYFQKDIFEVLATGKAHSRATLAFFAGANCFLVGLQLYWAYLILGRAYKTLVQGDKSD